MRTQAYPSYGRDTVDTQIAYIREFVKEQDDMVSLMRAP